MRMTLPNAETRAQMLATGMESGMEANYVRLEGLSPGSTPPGPASRRSPRGWRLSHPSRILRGAELRESQLSARTPRRLGNLPSAEIVANHFAWMGGLHIVIAVSTVLIGRKKS